MAAVEKLRCHYFFVYCSSLLLLGDDRNMPALIADGKNVTDKEMQSSSYRAIF